MKELLRVGVVGTSSYMENRHLPALKSHKQAQLAAICGRGQERAHQLAAKYKIPFVCSDYHEMMRKDLLDAVVIAVPDDLHYPVTMAALDAGLHVLSEKPMAMNLVQANTMLEKAEATGIKHMVFFTYRWAPWVRLLQKLLAEVFTGQPKLVQVEYIAGYGLDGSYQWKWDCQHGLGALGDLGSHAIDLAQLCAGGIARVQASLKTQVARKHPQGLPFVQANDTANLEMQFASGASGTISCSAVTNVGRRGQIQRVQVSGPDGVLEMTADGTNWRVCGRRQGEKGYQTFPIPAEFMAGAASSLLYWAARIVAPQYATWAVIASVFTSQPVGTRLFVESILQDCPITPGFREGVQVQSVIDACFRSYASGCWEETISGYPLIKP